MQLARQFSCNQERGSFGHIRTASAQRIPTAGLADAPEVTSSSMGCITSTLSLMSAVISG
eukprot:6166527-Pyramimonas_sp.AAC.1